MEESSSNIIFCELEKLSKGAIPLNQREECRQLFINALKESAAQQNNGIFDEGKIKKLNLIIKSFFEKFKEVMDEDDMIPIASMIRNELLWFLSPFR